MGCKAPAVRDPYESWVGAPREGPPVHARFIVSGSGLQISFGSREIDGGMRGSVTGLKHAVQDGGQRSTAVDEDTLLSCDENHKRCRRRMPSRVRRHPLPANRWAYESSWKAARSASVRATKLGATTGLPSAARAASCGSCPPTEVA